jgi:UDP-N-acetyl-D-glucosamine dehydrogenase
VSFDLVVVGLGYVGLPVAEAAVSVGLKVAGYDLSTGVVEQLNSGRSHIGDLTDDQVAAMVARGFLASTDAAVLAGAGTIVVCVPTPLTSDGGPDLGPVRGAIAQVAKHLSAGTLVILESTTYPGTTDEIVRPALEATGLQVGTDIHLAFSPERIDPGNPTWGLRNTPKIVGGCTPSCTTAAESFYRQFVDTVVPASGTREAEMSKLLENTYRHVNIALVNELSRYCHSMDIDLWDVIRLASTKPFGFQAFWPGPGVGGHCIPVDPGYLAYKIRADLGEQFGFIALAQDVNDAMPGYVVRRCQDLLNDQGQAVRSARVLLLGVSYKPNVADTRESPAYPVASGFARLGADVGYHDPFNPTWDAPGVGQLTSVPDLDDAVRDADLVVLLQQHRTYDAKQLAATARLLFDTRGVVAERKGVERL